MIFIKTSIPGILLLEPKVFRDQRGYFMETFQARLFAEQGLPTQFVQDNHSSSVKGCLRGLHYQFKQSQGKLVRVVRGEIFDVAVDLRRNSPTFGRWIGQNLSEENKHQLWIPAGFAHGFYVLSDQAEVVYKATDYYAPEWERTLVWNDPEIGVEWPLLDEREPLLSDKDRTGKLLRSAELID